MTNVKQNNTIRSFALVCVAVTSVFILVMIVWTTRLLADGNWCERAIGAAKEASSRPEYAVSACFDLLKQQVAALANNGLIYAGVIALSLLTLMVIVVAGGKLSFRGPGNVGGEIGGASPLVEGAQRATNAAQEATNDLAAQGEEGKA